MEGRHIEIVNVLACNRFELKRFSHDDGCRRAPLAVPEDLVAVADQLTLEVEDARRRCADLTAEDVSLPMRDQRVYSFAMIELPASYKEYLADKSEHFVDTVRPVLMQSAADRLHGVSVVNNPSGHQAHLDDTLPFGVVLEDID